MKYISILFLVAVMVSCSTTEERAPLQIPFDFTEINEEEINEYLVANDLESQKTATGLHYIIENQGDGDKPTANSIVKVEYKGYFLDGTVFDQSTEGITIGLSQVIRGWTEGIPLFNAGGNGVLLVPSHLGYGSYDYNTIPGGSVLVFDIKLIAVN